MVVPWRSSARQNCVDLVLVLVVLVFVELVLVDLLLVAIVIVIYLLTLSHNCLSHTSFWLAFRLSLGVLGLPFRLLDCKPS